MMTNTFRKEYKPLIEEQIEDCKRIKDHAQNLLDQLDRTGVNYSIDDRAMALAKTNLEQAIMWAIKAIT
jgi:hypothetical protein